MSAGARRVEVGGIRADTRPEVDGAASPTNGVAAIKLAVDRRDPEALSREAHSLKGSSATFGAARLATVCEALERAGGERDIERAGSLVTELEEAAAATEVALERHLTAGLRT